MIIQKQSKYVVEYSVIFNAPNAAKAFLQLLQNTSGVFGTSIQQVTVKFHTFDIDGTKLATDFESEWMQKYKPKPEPEPVPQPSDTPQIEEVVEADSASTGETVEEQPVVNEQELDALPSQSSSTPE